MKKQSINNRNLSKFLGQDVEKERNEFTQELINDFGFSRSRAQRWVDNHIKIANDTVREFVESINSSR
jgi:hypothetical protein